MLWFGVGGGGGRRIRGNDSTSNN